MTYLKKTLEWGEEDRSIDWENNDNVKEGGDICMINSNEWGNI